MQYPHPLSEGCRILHFFVPSTSETAETGTEKTDRRNEKNRVFTQKSVNVYVIFYPKHTNILIFFYILLQQENQDSANAMHQGCPTRSLREPRGTAMIKQLLRTGILLKNIK